MKIGFSKDIHKLKKGDKKPLILAGLDIKNANFYIEAHSDGDLILHSITSAILGALELETLGDFFPDQEKSNKNRSSTDFLNFGLSKLSERGLKITSMDLCIICEKIILKDYLKAMRESLKKIIGFDVNIGIKATRFEDKKNKNIECYCSLLIE